MLLFLACLIGVIAGLRAMTAPAAVSWAAYLEWFDLSQTPLAFLGYQWTPWIFSALAVVELITDQLPSTPSRKVPLQFGTRIVMGALTGGAIGAAGGSLGGGGIARIIGAVGGTHGGAGGRGRPAGALRQGPPAGLVGGLGARGGGPAGPWPVA